VSLARFEQIVLTQTPAARQWSPVTDYSFEGRKQIEGRHPQLIKDVFKPQYVLDMGAGPGHLVRMLRALGIKAKGYDKYADAIHGIDEFDLTWYLHDEWDEWADLVICREVLEHLTIREIRRAVTTLCDLSTRFVYVTTRFAKEPHSLLDVDTSDELDPTHISMLHQDLLRVLFVLEGFKRRADLEDRLDWRHAGRVLIYERAA
jgi:hypothetical protein